MTTVLPIAPVPVTYAAAQTTTPQPRDIAIDQRGEIVLTPAGDLGFVSGAARVAQDVWMLAMQPVGSNMGDPALGSALAGLVGRRMPDATQLAAYANLLAKQVQTLHQKRIAQGDTPGGGEAIASVACTATRVGPTAISAPLAVTTQAGVSLPVTVTL